MTVTPLQPVQRLRVDRMQVLIYPTEADLGDAAAAHTARIISERVAEHGSARIMLATGNSQLAFVRALRKQPALPWDAVTVFHLDEYVGIAHDHPASFRRWIRSNIAEPLAPAVVHYIDGDAADLDAECLRYEELLRAAPLDLVCMGIGENGHIAFNEPHEANLHDTAWVRVIELDKRSRTQQAGEGHFASPADVPRRAISLTVPALLAPEHLQICVPERRKAEAVHAAFTAPVGTACPATVLRGQANATLFLDVDSASQIMDNRSSLPPQSTVI